MAAVATAANEPSEDEVDKYEKVMTINTISHILNKLHAPQDLDTLLDNGDDAETLEELGASIAQREADMLQDVLEEEGGDVDAIKERWEAMARSTAHRWVATIQDYVGKWDRTQQCINQFFDHLEAEFAEETRIYTSADIVQLFGAFQFCWFAKKLPHERRQYLWMAYFIPTQKRPNFFQALERQVTNMVNTLDEQATDGSDGVDGNGSVQPVNWSTVCSMKELEETFLYVQKTVVHLMQMMTEERLLIPDRLHHQNIVKSQSLLHLVFETFAQVRCMYNTYLLCNDSKGVIMFSDIFSHQYFPQQYDDLKPIEEALQLILQRVQQKRYRRGELGFYQVIRDKDGYSTSAWRHVCSIEDFVNQEILGDELERKLKQLLMAHPGRRSQIISTLKDVRDVRLPDLKRERMAYSFTNGVYILAMDQFFPHSAQILPNDTVANNYFETEFDNSDVDDFLDIPTPMFDLIFTFSGIGKYGPHSTPEEIADAKKTMRIIFGMIGRNLYPLGAWDDWQMVFALIGDGGTGKTTVLEVLSDIIGAFNIFSVINNCHETFPIEGIDGKQVWMFNDVDENWKLEPKTFNNMASSDVVTEQRRHQTPIVHHRFDKPGIGTSNGSFGGVDIAGQMIRRIFSIFLNRVVDDKDKIDGLRDIIFRNEAHNVLRKINKAYIWLVNEAKGKSVWTVATTPYLKKCRSRMYALVNTQAGFVEAVNDGDIDLECCTSACLHHTEANMRCDTDADKQIIQDCDHCHPFLAKKERGRAYYSHSKTCSYSMKGSKMRRSYNAYLKEYQIPRDRVIGYKPGELMPVFSRNGLNVVYHPKRKQWLGIRHRSTFGGGEGGEPSHASRGVKRSAHDANDGQVDAEQPPANVQKRQ